MDVTVTVDNFTPEQWSALAATFTDYNIYQTWHFGAGRAAEMRAEVSRLAVHRGDALIGLAQARIKRVPLLGAGVAHILFGPLWRRAGARAGDLQAVLEAIRAEYATRRGLNVQLVPNLPDGGEQADVMDTLDRAGFARDSLTEPYDTFRLDLTPSLEQLRKALAQKWRNGLNQAERNGVSVVARTDAGGMTEFAALYVEMKARKAFGTNVSIDLFQTVQSALPADEKPVVLLALVDGQAVAGHVSSTLGDTCIYLLGASSEAGRTLRASYLLQWHAIADAKQAGARWYDLGGVDPQANPGTHHFKAGVGGEECRFPGQFCADGGRASRYLMPLAKRAYHVVRG